MCNEAYRRRSLGEIAADWGQTGIPLRFPEGAPNMAPLDGFRITDRVEIIRAAAAEPVAAELVTRRWSWPTSAANPRPVYNFRSDGRTITPAQRCLIPVDGFFEFTAPADPKQKRKDKWAFTLVGHAWFCIAGIWRTDPQVGEAWAMLTCPPGPDVAPYHDRQVVVLDLPAAARWLDPAVPAAELTRPLPAGSLAVAPAR